MGYFVDKRDFKKCLELELNKALVTEYFKKYCDSYDNFDKKTIQIKIEHRELFKQYTDYMYFSGKK